MAKSAVHEEKEREECDESARRRPFALLSDRVVACASPTVRRRVGDC